MAKQTGALVFTVGADTRPLARNLKKARGMVSGFGAGMGRAGAGLAKVGGAAAVGLGATILAARGAFRGLMRLAPYSDQLATALGNMVNVQEDLKRKVAEDLAPSVDALSKAMQDASPAISDAVQGFTKLLANTVTLGAALATPGKAGSTLDFITTAFAQTIERQFMNNSRLADQMGMEWGQRHNRGNGFASALGWESYAPGEAGTDQLGAGASGGGRAGDYQALVEAAQQTARNTAAQGAGF